MKKSYWTKVACRTERDKTAIKSWFAGLCDDMTPESAEALCDTETHREKKIRALMVRSDGSKRLCTRTLGGKTSTIAMRPV